MTHEEFNQRMKKAYQKELDRATEIQEIFKSIGFESTDISLSKDLRLDENQAKLVHLLCEFKQNNGFIEGVQRGQLDTMLLIGETIISINDKVDNQDKVEDQA